jgi:hypothetical protein
MRSRPQRIGRLDHDEFPCQDAKSNFANSMSMISGSYAIASPSAEYVSPVMLGIRTNHVCLLILTSGLDCSFRSLCCKAASAMTSSKHQIDGLTGRYSSVRGYLCRETPFLIARLRARPPPCDLRASGSPAASGRALIVNVNQ